MLCVEPCPPLCHHGGDLVTGTKADGVGFFGKFLFDGQAWTEVESGTRVAPPDAEFWLVVDIHDSDFAAVQYRPAGPGSGIAFLGYTPRSYFGRPEAPRTDVDREAAGLAAWWAGRQGDAAGASRDAMAAGIRPFLAADLDPSDLGPSDPDAGAPDAGSRDDDDIFVETKTDRFLVTLGLPPLPMPVPS